MKKKSTLDDLRFEQAFHDFYYHKKFDMDKNSDVKYQLEIYEMLINALLSLTAKKDNKIKELEERSQYITTIDDPFDDLLTKEQQAEIAMMIKSAKCNNMDKHSLFEVTKSALLALMTIKEKLIELSTLLQCDRQDCMELVDILSGFMENKQNCVKSYYTKRIDDILKRYGK